MTHDYPRHATASLFAAVEVASGKVYGRFFKSHTHVEFISFWSLWPRAIRSSTYI
jgi:hypothetical protein